MSLSIFNFQEVAGTGKEGSRILTDNQEAKAPSSSLSFPSSQFASPVVSSSPSFPPHPTNAPFPAGPTFNPYSAPPSSGPHQLSSHLDSYLSKIHSLYTDTFHEEVPSMTSIYSSVRHNLHDSSLGTPALCAGKTGNYTW